MNDAERRRILRQMFEDAINTRGPEGDTTSEHFVQDVDLLLDWTTGDLAESQHEEILDHMAACSSCRREVVRMHQAGALVFLGMEEEEPDVPEDGENEGEDPITEREVVFAAEASHPRLRRNYGLMVALLTVAAALLIAFVWGNHGGGGSDSSRVLAMVDKNLVAGRFESAFENVTKLLESGESLSDGERLEAERHMEQAGYRTARERLANGEFRTVSDIENRVAEHTGGSARMINLRLQAERGEVEERSLAGRMSLIRDYGYDPGIKKGGFPPPKTPTVERHTADLYDAVAKHPDSLDLRLNLGQFLLEQREFAKAEEQFAEAALIDSSSALAETGLGIALIQRGKTPEALDHFQRAVELDPANPVAKENLAVCLRQLERK